MYRCQATGKIVPRGTDAHKLVTHIRNKTYYRWNHKTDRPEVIGEGTEIVRELLVCKEYYDQAIANGFQPELVKTTAQKENLAIQKDKRERRSYDEDVDGFHDGLRRVIVRPRDRSEDSRVPDDDSWD
jgi:hypothetical protein